MKDSNHFAVLAIILSAFLLLPLQGFAADIAINQDTVWEQGVYSYDNVSIIDGAKLIFKGSVTLNCANLTVAVGASILADGMGYPGQLTISGMNGPGGGVSEGGSNVTGSGAGYGGRGGDGHDFAGGQAYGDAAHPVDLGSGGGKASGPGGDDNPVAGGSGGGAVGLNVPGTLRVDGRISSDGGSGDFRSGLIVTYGSGGDPGIDLYHDGNLTGSGVISAKGGMVGLVRRRAGSRPAWRGGAGGRVAIYARTSGFSGTFQAQEASDTRRARTDGS